MKITTTGLLKKNLRKSAKFISSPFHGRTALIDLRRLIISAYIINRLDHETDIGRVGAWRRLMNDFPIDFFSLNFEARFSGGVALLTLKAF